MPGTLFPAKQTRQYRFGGALLPAPCLLSVPHPVQRGYPRLLRGQGCDRAQVREAGGSKWALLFLLFSLVTQSCPTLCDPRDCSTPGFPVLHQLPELAETHVQLVGDAIQPSHPLKKKAVLPLLPSIFPSIRVFSNESVLHIRWPKYWRLSFSISSSNEYSGLISFRMDWLDLLAVQGTLKSLLQHHSSSVLSFLYSPTLASIRDYWENYSFD